MQIANIQYRLERELKANGRLTDEVLAAAPQIEGYRLMRVRGKDDSVCYVCDDVELSMEDIITGKFTREEAVNLAAALNSKGGE